MEVAPTFLDGLKKFATIKDIEKGCFFFFSVFCILQTYHFGVYFFQ